MTPATHQILVIEDEPASRSVLRVLLGSHGYRLIEAETAMRGEIEARNHKPDLLLVDLGLPDGSRLVVVRNVRSSYATNTHSTRTPMTTQPRLRAVAGSIS